MGVRSTQAGKPAIASSMRPALQRAQTWCFAVICVLFTLLPQGLPAASAAGGHLFYSAEDLPSLRARSGSEAGREIMARLDQLSAPEQGPTPNWKQAHKAAGLALRQLLQSPPLTAPDKSLIPGLIRDSLTQRERAGELPPLTAAASTLYGASMAFDLGRDEFDSNTLEELAKLLLSSSKALATRALTDGRGGAMDLEAGAAFAAACMAASLAESVPAFAQVAGPQAKACANAAHQILGKQGKSGWPREAFPALRRSLAHGLGAFLYIEKRLRRETAADTSYSRSLARLYTILLIPAPGGSTRQPATQRFGPASLESSSFPEPDWGVEGQASGDLLMLSCLADAGTRAALLWTYQRCHGSRLGNGTLDMGKASDALFALAGPLLVEQAGNPARTLARVWKDEEAGILFMRNQWEGPEDFLVAFHANNRPHPHLGSFADAGSFRLMGLGGRWAVRRAMDTADLPTSAPEKENVVVIPGTHGWLGGTLVKARAQPDGSASMTAILDAVHTVAPPANQAALLVPTHDIGIRALRCMAVNYSGRCGAPVLLVVVDRIQNGPPRRWLMHTAQKGVELKPDGFILKAANGATLRATVIAPARPRMSVTEGRWTDTIAIDGDGNFMVVMTVQPAGEKHPRVETDGRDIESMVRLGKSLIRYDGQEIAIH